jgi:uncharacterized protein (TIGR04255 family)
LLGPLSDERINTHVKQAIQQIVLRFDPDEGISFRHGVLEGTAVQPRPGEEPPTSRYYLLDYDAFREYPRAGSLLVDPEVICSQVETQHEVIHRLFRWSMTDAYTASLGERNRG